MIPFWALGLGAAGAGFLVLRRMQPPGQRAAVGDTIVVPISAINLSPIDPQGNNVRMTVTAADTTTLQAIPSGVERADGSIFSLSLVTPIPIARTAVIGLNP